MGVNAYNTDYNKLPVNDTQSVNTKTNLLLLCSCFDGILSAGCLRCAQPQLLICHADHIFVRKQHGYRNAYYNISFCEETTPYHPSDSLIGMLIVYGVGPQ